VVGGDEVAAAPEREGEQAAFLDFGLVGADGAQERAHVVHAAVVDAAQPARDLLVAAGPVAHGEVDSERVDANTCSPETAIAPRRASLDLASPAAPPPASPLSTRSIELGSR
jgi:hypothetical protein